jgi:hypothetical protein
MDSLNLYAVKSEITPFNGYKKVDTTWFYFQSLMDSAKSWFTAIQENSCTYLGITVS